MVEIEINFDVTERFTQLMYEACKHPYTLVNDGKLTLDEVREMLDKAVQTQEFHFYKRIGFLKIYYNHELVGLSVPREIQEREHTVWKLPDDKVYYRMGMIYLEEDYRGMGIGKIAAEKFKEWFKNVLWTFDPDNTASKKLAEHLNLGYRTTVYYNEKNEWSHREYDDTIHCVQAWSN